jgi:hypothetical protein
MRLVDITVPYLISPFAPQKKTRVPLGNAFIAKIVGTTGGCERELRVCLVKSCPGHATFYNTCEAAGRDMRAILDRALPKERQSVIGPSRRDLRNLRFTVSIESQRNRCNSQGVNDLLKARK